MARKAKKNLKKVKATRKLSTTSKPVVSEMNRGLEKDPKSGSNNYKNSLRKLASRRYLLIALVIVLLLALAYRYKGFFVVASVNGKPISRYSVIKALEKQQGSQALDGIITETLIDQQAKKANITASDADVNERLTKIEDNLKAQGQTLDAALALQGMTRNELIKQLGLQIKAEKILADKISVSDDEVNKYIQDNKANFPKDLSSADQITQAKQALSQQKISTQFQTWLADVRKNSKILYFWNY